MRTWLLSALLLVSTTVACEAKKDPPAPAAPATEAAKPSADESAAEPKASPVESDASGKTKRSYDTDSYQVTVLAEGCKANTACTATLELTAKAGYHVNEEFPAKFTARAASGVTYKGKDKPEEFSKAAGDFTIGSPEKATMQVRYEADGSGRMVPLGGKFKLSVCSDAACLIADPELDVPVPLT